MQARTSSRAPERQSRRAPPLSWRSPPVRSSLDPLRALATILPGMSVGVRGRTGRSAQVSRKHAKRDASRRRRRGQRPTELFMEVRLIATPPRLTAPRARRRRRRAFGACRYHERCSGSSRSRW